MGRSYPPEFYSFIKNVKIRSVFEKIASETEEDYQTLISLLESHGVEVMRPEIVDSDLIKSNDYINKAPMAPRDFGGMFGETFYFDMRKSETHEGRAANYDHILGRISKTNEVVNDKNINTALITRLGKDLYIGTKPNQFINGLRSQEREVSKILEANLTYSEAIKKYTLENELEWERLNNIFKNRYRTHWVDTEGHSDGCYCPVAPGLIISRDDMGTYSDTFPEWEVITVDNNVGKRLQKFIQLKEKNHGKWWVKGEEFNDEFTDYVESWMSHWVGYVSETVFDVNILMIDEKNAVVNGYNKKVFEAFDRYRVTPHILKFRHRFFWDGGVHCITLDLHREGEMKDYFPERE